MRVGVGGWVRSVELKRREGGGDVGTETGTAKGTCKLLLLGWRFCGGCPGECLFIFRIFLKLRLFKIFKTE